MKEIRWFLTGLLFLFITLKLTDQIDWSWWVVMSPFLVPMAIAAFGLMLQGIAWVFMSEDARKRRKLARALEHYGNALSRK